jgi:hypothetical protein
MQRAVVLAVAAGVVAAGSVVVAVGLPRYGCPGGFVVLDPREFPGLSEDAICVPDSGVYATPGEVSDRGPIKIAAAIAGLIIGGVALFALRGRRGRESDMTAPEPGGAQPPPRRDRNAT